jgi:hypothetical protein
MGAGANQADQLGQASFF